MVHARDFISICVYYIDASCVVNNAEYLRNHR